MPSSHTPRPTRTQPRIHLEALESRRLMASIIRTPPTAVVYIQNIGSTVSQLSDSAEVSLKRTNNLKGAIQVVISTEPPPEAAQPVPSLDPSKTYLPGLPGLTPVPTPGLTPVPTPSLPLAVAGQNYTSIHEVVRFAPGEETKTVTVPLIAGAAGPGERALPIYVTPASPGVQGVSGMLKLVDRVDVTPPSIVGSRLVGLGGGRGGIELTFSEPMDPASVENPANYAVSENTHRPNGLDVARFVLTGTVENHSAKVKIISATYDPAARTVTLASARPLKASAEYGVMNAQPRLSGRGRSARLNEVAKLTDASGNPISAGGPVTGFFSASIDGTGRGASRPRGPKAVRL